VEPPRVTMIGKPQIFNAALIAVLGGFAQVFVILFDQRIFQRHKFLWL